MLAAAKQLAQPSYAFLLLHGQPISMLLDPTAKADTFRAKTIGLVFAAEVMTNGLTIKSK